MEFNTSFTELRYRHEVILAKLEVRDHYLHTIVREIYENTGQLLSLVRVQLSTISSKLGTGSKSGISDSGNLVGRVIYDLREMSKNFFPENEILSSESGLVNALKRELKIDSKDETDNKIKVRGIPSALLPGPGIIFFSVILEITTMITNSYETDSLKLEIYYLNTKLKISLDYSGEPFDFNNELLHNNVFSETTKLNVIERIQLIGGKISVKNKKGKRTRIDVSLPYDNCRLHSYSEAG